VGTTRELFACVGAGALVQCMLILKARRFPPSDWAYVLLLMLVPPTGWFFFIRICSTWNDAFDALIVGLMIGMALAGWFLLEQAPARMTSTAVVSLTVTFWAALWPHRFYAVWVCPALAMSAAVLALTFGPWTPPRPARLLLYAWSMFAAAAIAAESVHWSKIMIDENLLSQYSEFRLAPIEAALMGAQFFVFMELSMGLMFLLQGRRDDDYAESLVSSYDAASRPSLIGIALVLLQTVVLVVLRRSGASLENAGISASMLVALSHGALTGEDAGARARADPGLSA
jgi:hypothetical protein